MSVEMNRESLDKVGVELVSQLVKVLKCKTCGYVWAPLSARDDGRFPNYWWICPNTPDHKQPNEKKK